MKDCKPSEFSSKVFSSMAALLSLTILLVSSCSKVCHEDFLQQDYVLVLEDGIYVEEFASGVTDENRYNANNEIYQVCKEFTFDYFYQDTDGDRFLMEKTGNDDGATLQEEFTKWEFIPFNEPNKKTTTQIKKVIKAGLGQFTEIIPGYNQTVFDYVDVLEKGKCIKRASTGLIENENNVWTHPPRHGLFAMLEFAPFPFIQVPYEVGNSWVFDFISISGEEWSDPRWLEFEGQLDIVSTYEITAFTAIETSFGLLDCFEISAEAANTYGVASLVSYFNEEYGFVRFEYINIDGSLMVIDLVDVEEN